MTFKKDLESGQGGVEFVIGVLAKAGIVSEDRGSKDGSERDLLCLLGGGRFGVEVKRDLMEAKTGNIALEYWNSKQDKPSGITATKSDLWVFVLGDKAGNANTCWVANTKDLKEYAEFTKPLRDLKSVGDGNASIKLYDRRKIFEGIFHRLDNLASEDIKSLLKKLLGDKYAG